MEEILNKAKLWLSESFDSATRNEIEQLISEKSDDLADRFYKNLEFGTGGMRGIVGAGTNRINKYTLGKATQGLSNYLHQIHPKKELKVAIGYDCRHDSKWLSKVVADVFSANNIKVFLFEDLRPTPELSFAVNHLGCDVGIVLTASHNPPEYNGYKVYWSDGGQIVPPQDTAIINEVNSLAFTDINFKANEELISSIGSEIDEAFWQASIKNGTFDVKNRKDLKIVFTNLHGTAIKLIPEVLKRAGYTQVHIVEEQAQPNGSFPTVKSPNPEEPEALKMAVDLANKVGADIVLGTDPDSDRIGIAVRDLEGNMKLLNGNQTMSMMTDFLINDWKNNEKLNGKQFVGSTIVSTNLVNEIASSYGVETKVGLTGFKWIAKMIKDFPELDFIGGGEESFGYMVGDFVRDKDAVTAALLACEIATNAKANNSSFYQELLELYTRHHFYKEHLIAIVKKGMDGAQQIKQMMADLRSNPFTEMDGAKVEFLYDYQSSIKKNLITGEEILMDIPKSNVLIYQTTDGTKMAARPSGTEPKIKFYFSVNTKLENIKNAEAIEASLDAKIQRIIKEMKLN
ncbi:phospho-sugar mutase [Tenacibaculum finnmarkense genomovar finnmarkense]|uniref:phospho-sugar mutase n=1 Tax=Tenacibaculum finnmarkense TaxID=2781243 RepID=UPI001E39C8CB|nr:phospho-sugar mutase [Tenacibaculum finnmarkense]MCD8417909.1 phospho-sugar mutase [Tenacibaculum finnmarkense genomovar finnmarkense]MCG8202808.1 phospho-sugar mutase [Tenacibaculum finnmarkense genomovar finnmarkense]MCG8210536.1 phospho-sugar mutase [Tenacibaculum finnmarkense genomovar finnmarkense]MCG8213064.1 phospho-sugar mutase [Tenacibaculum finnmarkense genomovar finnmarkense]MCG8220495.1 phospho-sugar mutase [Tenacibaculum finnmarkense genomovar finnmarkense]